MASPGKNNQKKALTSQLTGLFSQPMTREQAMKLGYVSMTVPYNLPNEQWMLENVLADMRRCKIDAVVIDNEVWRKPAKD